MNKHLDIFKDQIEQVMGVKTKITRRRKNINDLKKDLFLSIITNIELALNRSSLASNELDIHLNKYDEVFFQIIDKLILYSFEGLANDLIVTYCYERTDGMGGISYVNEKKETVIINNPEELWEEIQRIKDL